MIFNNPNKPQKKYTVELDEGKSVTYEVDACWHNPYVINLCSRCYEPFVGRSDRKIILADRNQHNDSGCDICLSRYSNTFVVFERINNQAA